MSQRGTARPDLDYEQLAPTVDYVNRVVQVAGKYTLDEPFEVGWGNVVLDVTPRGLSTRTFRHPEVAFRVHYRLLDGDVLIESDRGTRTLSLRHESVASFYRAFCGTAAGLGIGPPDSSLICEIPGSPPAFEDDRVPRDWDADAARLMNTAVNLAADGLETWQAPYLGHRPRVGVMWGGFDLSATRWRPQRTTPTPGRPAFQQNAELHAYLSVGFSFGSSGPRTPACTPTSGPSPTASAPAPGASRAPPGTRTRAWSSSPGRPSCGPRTPSGRSSLSATRSRPPPSTWRAGPTTWSARAWTAGT